MTDKEKRLVSALLMRASNEFCNHGCDDLDEDFWDGWSNEERRQLIAEYYIYNEEPEEAKEGRIDIEDWVLMRHMARKLLK